ncbi:CaiF/GrlA family transcriptional regulator [Serratia bockelmannii]|uniref:CaiF/GrlA family transcriptional regulator n=1 Tax=Serratia bockelmannii TaxID=2703793 RepID=UPI003FA6E223
MVSDRKDDGSDFVKLRQSNHGGYMLPAELKYLQALPLYMVIAHWGLLSGKPFSRTDISQTFHISLRRAADIMTYIYTHKGEMITARKIKRKLASGHVEMSLLIEDIGTQKSPASGRTEKHGGGKRQKSPPGQSDLLRQTYRWLLTSKF